MATNGTLTSNTYTTSSGNNSRYINFYWYWTGSVNGDTPYSTIHWILTIKGSSSASGNYIWGRKIKLLIDGAQKYYNASDIKAYADTYITEGDYTVYHNKSTGDGSFTAYVEGAMYGYAVNVSGGTQTFYLDNLPRKANFTGYGSTGYYDYIDAHWTADATCNAHWWSVGNGWNFIGNINASSGTFKTSALNPNTNYSLGVQIRRSVSNQLNEVWWTISTSKIARMASAKNFYLSAWSGDSSTATVTTNYTIADNGGTKAYLERTSGGMTVVNGDKKGKDQTGTFTINTTVQNQLYQEHANVTTPYNGHGDLRATSGVQAVIQSTGLYGSFWSVYPIVAIMSEANCGPTALAECTYKETQSYIGTLTGSWSNGAAKSYSDTATGTTNVSKLNLIKGYSGLTISAPANPLTTRAYATNKYISLGGSASKTSTVATSHTINNVTVKSYSIYATDSRNFGLSRTVEVNLLDYFLPKINVATITRNTGEGQSAFVTLEGTFWNGNFGAVANSIKNVKVWIKQKGTSNETGYNLGSDILTINGNNFSCSNLPLLSEGTSGSAIEFTLGTEYDARFEINDAFCAEGGSYTNLRAIKNTTVSSGKFLFSAKKDEGICFGGLYNESTGGAAQLAGMPMTGFNIESSW